MSEKQQRLVLSIIDFLNHSINDGTVKADDKESLEVAVQCIGEAFGVDPNDSKQVEKLSIKPITLLQVFDVFMKTREKAQASSTGPTSSSAPESSPENPSKEEREEAEKLKTKGNSLMSEKKYDAAIEAYSQAIDLDATNPVYFSNRAAAHTSKGDHISAIGDAEKAISVNPNFVKAYHRLGHGYYCMADYKSAVSAFERGLRHDPNNPALKSGLRDAKARVTDDELPAATTSRSAPGAEAGAGAGAGLGGMADMLKNLGGGGGGMPDIASLMNNPQLMAMAQQMAANGGLDSLMRNPSVADMMNRVQSGDMPSMDEIMGDPALRDLASKFGSGARP